MVLQMRKKDNVFPVGGGGGTYLILEQPLVVYNDQWHI